MKKNTPTAVNVITISYAHLQTNFHIALNKKILTCVQYQITDIRVLIALVIPSHFHPRRSDYAGRCGHFLSMPLIFGPTAKPPITSIARERRVCNIDLENRDEWFMWARWKCRYNLSTFKNKKLIIIIILYWTYCKRPVVEPVIVLVFEKICIAIGVMQNRVNVIRYTIPVADRLRVRALYRGLLHWVEFPELWA